MKHTPTQDWLVNAWKFYNECSHGDPNRFRAYMQFKHGTLKI